MKRLLVVGGGITGLSLTHFLRKSALRAGSACQITLVDSQDRFGGWLQSTQKPASNPPFLFEFGPHSLRATKKEMDSTLELICDVGLSNSVITPSFPAKPFIFVNDDKPVEVTKLRSILFRGILSDLFTGRTAAQDESIYDWGGTFFFFSFCSNLQ